MYSTYYQANPSRLSRLMSWLASPNIVHAIGASLVVIATITTAYGLGELDFGQPATAHAAALPAVTPAATPASKEPERWAADQSASGTPPEYIR